MANARSIAQQQRAQQQRAQQQRAQQQADARKRMEAERLSQAANAAMLTKALERVKDIQQAVFQGRANVSDVQRAINDHHSLKAKLGA